MAGTSPIQLGSAIGGSWTFESGSAASTDEFGIQTVNVNALFPNGDTVLSNIPAEGSSISSVVAGSYLPSDFKLDFFEAAPGVEYLDARVARGKFKFKRIDPNWVGKRIVSIDSVINYANDVAQQILVLTNGLLQNKVFGFPDPTATIKYSDTSAPGIGTGGLSNIYTITQPGFPAVPDIPVPYSFQVPAGSVITYWNGTAFVSVTVLAPTTLNYNLIFVSNPLGWQLVDLKYDPIANGSFFSVQEQWRNFYSFKQVDFVSAIPPFPP